MGRPKRLYPLGKYRLRTPKEVDKDKAYPVELEYTWNRRIILIFVHQKRLIKIRPILSSWNILGTGG